MIKEEKKIPAEIHVYYGGSSGNTHPDSYFIEHDFGYEYPWGDLQKPIKKHIPMRWLFYPIVMIIFILITMLLVSCGGVKHWQSLPVCVDASTDEEKEVLDYFNESYGGSIFEYGCDAPDITIEYVNDFEQGSFNGYSTIKSSLVDGSIKSSHIQLKTELIEGDDLDQFKRVFAHELGHSLGHIEHNEEGLMKDPVEEEFYENLIDDFMEEWVLDMYPHQETDS